MKKEKSYYKKIVFILSAFTVLVLVPSVCILFSAAKSQVQKTIESSNAQYFKQITYNYEQANDAIRKFCLSIYVDSEKQAILHSASVNPREANTQMLQIKNDINTTHDSVISVVLYNSLTKKIYSTMQGNYIISSDDALKFFKESANLPKLVPVARKIVNERNGDSLCVFSYVIYDYTPDSESTPSFVIVNQNANWMLDRLISVGTPNSNFFIVDDLAGVCASTKTCSESFANELFQKYSGKRKEASETSGSFDITLQGNRYIVSYLDLDVSTSDIVMLQDYNAVYSGLAVLRNWFLAVLIIISAIYIAGVLMISRWLYQPLADLIQYVNMQNQHPVLQQKSNEFETLAAVYREATQNVTARDKNTRDYLRMHQIEQMLSDSGASSRSVFSELFPAHWLAQNHCAAFQCVLVQLERHAGIKVREQDVPLYLYAAQNILEEVLSETASVEILQREHGRLLVICGFPNKQTQIQNALRAFSGYMQRYFGMTISICCSAPVFSAANIHSAYDDVCQLSNYWALLGREKIIGQADIEANLKNPDKVCPKALSDAVLNAIRKKDPDELKRQLESLRCFACGLNYNNLSLSILPILEDMDAALQENRKIANVSDIKFDISVYEQLFREDLGAFFEQLSDDILAEFTATTVTSSIKNQRFLDGIQEYIKSNYTDWNLSAQSIAEKMNISAKYLLKKYKNMTGNTLSKAILQIRMEHAAELLLTEKYSMAEIVQMVGLENVSYFYKQFKEYYGCTPKSYVQAENGSRHRADDSARL